MGSMELINNKRGKQRRVRRGSLDFGYMVWCELGKNPLVYNGYGCWCGVGGEGEPVDEIDQCCYVHDKCYDDIVDRGTCGWLSKYTIYGIFYWRSGCSGCSWFNTSCQKALCKCDSAAVRCFKKHNSKFQNSYKDYNRESC